MSIGPLFDDGLQTSRDEWERDWPDKQTRYLAWCNAVRRSPMDFNGAQFTAWISRRSSEFRALRGIKMDFVPVPLDMEFNAFLWDSFRLPGGR